MKVVLTEQQLNEIKQFEMVKNYLHNLVSKYVNKDSLGISQEEYDSLKTRLKACIKVVGITTVLVLLSNSPKIIQNCLNDIQHEEQIENVAINNNSEEQEKNNQLFQQKVQEVDNYIKYIVQLNNHNVNDIQVTPEAIIRYCDEYNYDPILLIAQAHYESCFGTTPRARRTNSIFSVGAYDNGKDMCKFNTQDESIPHYIRTMQKYYLPGKTVDDLFRDGFINQQVNKPYSQEKNYEKRLASIYKKVAQACPSL